MAKISRCDQYLLRRLLGGGGERVGRGHETNILPKLKDTGAYRSFKNNERFAQGYLSQLLQQILLVNTFEFVADCCKLCQNCNFKHTHTNRASYRIWRCNYLSPTFSMNKHL